MGKEDGLSPDIALAERAKIYKITTYKSSRPQLMQLYERGETLRWALNKEGFKITIWPIVDFNLDKHDFVDQEATEDGTIGYVSQKNGVSGSRVGSLDTLDLSALEPEEKALVKFAIIKYLTT